MALEASCGYDTVLAALFGGITAVVAIGTLIFLGHPHFVVASYFSGTRVTGGCSARNWKTSGEVAIRGTQLGEAG